MQSIFRPLFAAMVVLATLGSSACGADDAAPVEADRALTVDAARLVLPPPGRDTAAGYLTLGNQGDAPLTVNALSSDAYGRVEMHTMEHEGGMMRMRQLDSIDIPAGGSVSLEPHGRHLMFLSPDPEPQPGGTVDVVIEYTVAERRHQRRVAVAVEAR